MESLAWECTKCGAAGIVPIGLGATAPAPDTIHAAHQGVSGGCQASRMYFVTRPIEISQEAFSKIRQAITSLALRQPETVVTPIIHLNGDRKETLLANLEAAYDAVRAAMDALRECSPNGRNYYPEPGRMQKAEAQHRARQEHMLAVYESLEAEAIAIDEQNPGRR